MKKSGIGRSIFVVIFPVVLTCTTGERNNPCDISGSNYQGPSITIQPTNKTIIEGESATFSISAGGPSPQYQWQFNGVTIVGATYSSYTINSADFSKNGLYCCIVQNSAASETSDTVTLTVYPDSNRYNEGRIEQFDDNSKLWEFNDYATNKRKGTIQNGLFYLETDSNVASLRTKQLLTNNSMNYTIEVRAKYISGMDKSMFGIVFSSNESTWNNLCKFNIDDYGNFYISKYVDDVTQWLNYVTKKTKAINIGNFNTLTITRVSTDAYFYINGTWVYSLSNLNSFGSSIGLYTQYRQKVAFDYLMWMEQN
jgi:hypothetical protein